MNAWNKELSESFPLINGILCNKSHGSLNHAKHHYWKSICCKVKGAYAHTRKKSHSSSLINSWLIYIEMFNLIMNATRQTTVGMCVYNCVSSTALSFRKDTRQLSKGGTLWNYTRTMKQGTWVNEYNSNIKISACLKIL